MKVFGAKRTDNYQRRNSMAKSREKEEGYCHRCAKLYRKCAGFYAYPNPECYVEKKKPDSIVFLIELKRNLEGK